MSDLCLYLGERMYMVGYFMSVFSPRLPRKVSSVIQTLMAHIAVFFCAVQCHFYPCYDLAAVKFHHEGRGK